MSCFFNLEAWVGQKPQLHGGLVLKLVACLAVFHEQESLPMRTTLVSSLVREEDPGYLDRIQSTFFLARWVDLVLQQR